MHRTTGDTQVDGHTRLDLQPQHNRRGDQQAQGQEHEEHAQAGVTEILGEILLIGIVTHREHAPAVHASGVLISTNFGRKTDPLEEAEEQHQQRCDARHACSQLVPRQRLQALLHCLTGLPRLTRLVRLARLARLTKLVRLLRLRLVRLLRVRILATWVRSRLAIRVLVAHGECSQSFLRIIPI